MKKLLLFALLVCLLPAVVWAQCTTPEGTTFTESFGDSDTLCWATGGSTCNNTWEAVAGTAHSIIESPAGSTDNTACAYSLQMDIPDATQSAIRTYGWFPSIPSGTTFDVYFSFRLAAQTIDNYANRILLSGMRDLANAGPFDVRIYRANAVLQLYAYGATGSDKITISAEQWVDVRVHVEAGDGASYIDVGGTQKTFTAGSYDLRSFWVGTQTTGGTDAITYQIGHIKIDSELEGLGDKFSAYIDFEDGNDTDTITTTILGNGTNCGNGVWSIAGTASYITVSEAAEKDLEYIFESCGVSFNDTGTRGIRYSPAVGTSNATANYTFYTTNQSVSIGFFFKHTVAQSGGDGLFSAGSIQNAAGTDSAPIHFRPWNADCIGEGNPHPCCTGSHTGCDDYSSIYQWADENEDIDITTGEWVWVTVQFNADGTHLLAVYNPATWAQIGDTLTTASDAATVPRMLRLGRNGSDSDTDAGYWWYDDVLVDYFDATFPLLPFDPTASNAGAVLLLGF